MNGPRLVLATLLLLIPARLAAADPPPVVTDVEGQPVAANAERLMKALEFNGAALPEAVAAATRIPADLIGRPDLGRLAPGAAADLAWLGEDLRTRAAWVAGERVYPVGPAPA